MLVGRDGSEYMQFLFVGKSKQKVYRRNLRTVEDLKNEIWEVTSEITQAELQLVSYNFLWR